MCYDARPMEPALDPTRHLAEPAAGKTTSREDSPSDVDRAVTAAADRADDFRRLGAERKADLLLRVTASLAGVSADIVALGCEAKGIPRGSAAEAEEWFAGPAIAVALARHHAESLRQVARRGSPKLSRWATKRTPEGRLVTHLAPMFPGGGVVETGLSFRVLHTEGTTAADVRTGQASLAGGPREPGTTAVLGAGNVASIPFGDVIHTLFVDGRTAVLKMNPVNAYLRGPFERALAPLIEPGYVQIVDGGAEVGAHLVQHPRITHVHLTGSAETHDRIVWGPPGPAQKERKASGKPLLDKPVTSELGNISPMLVTPYLYSSGEIQAMAEMIGTQLTNNASFNCNAGKVLVLPKGFPQRKLLLDTLVKFLEKVPVRKAYYPGAHDRHRALTAGRTGTLTVGTPTEHQLPWTLITDVDPAREDDPLFSTEPFCSLLSVVEVGPLDPGEFLEQAVTFCNDRLWGTLAASLFVPPLFEDDDAVEHALHRALLRLRYGAVGINVWPALVYATARAPWGGHPTGTLADVQSGVGFVHNPLFLPRVEKTIVRAPLHPVPRPPFIAGHKHGLAAARRLTAYSESPSFGAALSVAKAAVFG